MRAVVSVRWRRQPLAPKATSFSTLGSKSSTMMLAQARAASESKCPQYLSTARSVRSWHNIVSHKARRPEAILPPPRWSHSTARSPPCSTKNPRGSKTWQHGRRRPSIRRMKEKELRFALVCYGGVSLVLYMHGVIEEILKLSRASKAYHSVSELEHQADQSFEAVNGDDGRPHDTEDVYFALLQS